MPCWINYALHSCQGLNVYVNNVVICFLSDRTKTVIINGKVSRRLKINQSIVQGSGIGPILLLIYVLALKPFSILNLICKYADDTSILIPQHTNTRLEEEFLHIQSWAKEKRLKINKKLTLATKEIVFRRPSLRLYAPPTSMFK